MKKIIKKIIKLLRRPSLGVIKFYWRVFKPKTRGVKVVLVYKDQFLLVKHSYGFRHTFPGGGIKKRETPEDAAKREIKEELGIVLNEVVFAESFISTQFGKSDEIFVYRASLLDNKFVIDNIEIEEAGWFNKTNLPPLEYVSSRILDNKISLIG